MYDYSKFKEAINICITKLQDSSSDKKVLKALNKFLDALDSLDNLNNVERDKFLTIIFESIVVIQNKSS